MKSIQKTKKYALAFFLILILLCSATTTAYAGDEITVTVNGKKVESDVPAVINSGNTMLPFRAIFNALGVTDSCIQWNQNAKCIEVRTGEKYIFLAIGSSLAIVGDTPVTLNAPPYVENSRTLVPVRFVSESLGAKVEWVQESKTVVITK